MGSGTDRGHIPVYDRKEHWEFTHPKQERYKDSKGVDWIDKCQDSFTEEEYRGAMKFTIGKYMERLGKKDNIVLEVTKIADYANRWLEYEKEREETDGK